MKKANEKSENVRNLHMAKKNYRGMGMQVQHLLLLIQKVAITKYRDTSFQNHSPLTYLEPPTNQCASLMAMMLQQSHQCTYHMSLFLYFYPFPYYSFVRSVNFSHQLSCGGCDVDLQWQTSRPNESFTIIKKVLAIGDKRRTNYVKGVRENGERERIIIFFNLPLCASVPKQPLYVP